MKEEFDMKTPRVKMAISLLCVSYTRNDELKIRAILLPRAKAFPHPPPVWIFILIFSWESAREQIAYYFFISET